MASINGSRIAKPSFAMGGHATIFFRFFVLQNNGTHNSSGVEIKLKSQTPSSWKSGHSTPSGTQSPARSTAAQSWAMANGTRVVVSNVVKATKTRPEGTRHRHMVFCGGSRFHFGKSVSRLATFGCRLPGVFLAKGDGGYASPFSCRARLGFFFSCGIFCCEGQLLDNKEE